MSPSGFVCIVRAAAFGAREAARYLDEISILNSWFCRPETLTRHQGDGEHEEKCFAQGRKARKKIEVSTSSLLGRISESRCYMLEISVGHIANKEKIEIGRFRT